MSFLVDFINYLFSFCVKREHYDSDSDNDSLEDGEQHGYKCWGYMTDVDTSDYDSDNSELSVRSALYR